jgi:RNA polymerase sigma factor (sigma-70 family)
MAAVPSRVAEAAVPAEAAATQELYERHATRLHAFCLHRLGSREEAEDAVQTVFLNVFRALRKGVVPDAELSWLYRIAENVCRTRQRSSRRRGRVETPSDFAALGELVPAPPRGPRDELFGIEEALAAMPEQQRRALLLREWQGLSYREIAQELEISESAVETLIFRGRRSLARGLTEPVRRRGLRRALKAFDLGTIAASVKGLFEGAAAVKATATAVAVTATAGAVVTATPVLERVQRPKPKPPAATERAEQPAAAPGAPRVVVAPPERIRPVAARPQRRAAEPRRERRPARPPRAVGTVRAVPSAQQAEPSPSSAPAAVPPATSAPAAPEQTAHLPTQTPVPGPALAPTAPAQPRSEEPRRAGPAGPSATGEPRAGWREQPGVVVPPAPPADARGRFRVEDTQPQRADLGAPQPGGPPAGPPPAAGKQGPPGQPSGQARPAEAPPLAVSTGVGAKADKPAAGPPAGGAPAAAPPAAAGPPEAPPASGPGGTFSSAGGLGRSDD